LEPVEGRSRAEDTLYGLQGSPLEWHLMRAEPVWAAGLTNWPYGVWLQRGFAGRWTNTKNMIQTHTHKSVILVGTNHQLDRIARQRPNGRISRKRSTNPNRSPKSKRSTKNRVAKQEILNW
jgi:hypothetical protein